MHGRTIIKRCGVVIVLACVAVCGLTAQTADERVFFTFSGPVELPGVGLAPGKYLFRLPDAQDAHDIVQVLSADGKTSYGIFFTIPDERLTAPDKPEVRFMEAAASNPLPIRAYWMPGDTIGHEFIYPKQRATRLAKNASEPVLTTQANTTKTEETHTTALSRVSSSGSETAVDAKAKSPATEPKGPRVQGERAPEAIVVADVPIPARTESRVARSSLPNTGSDLPLVGLLGVTMLALALSIRTWRRTLA